MGKRRKGFFKKAEPPAGGAPPEPAAPPRPLAPVWAVLVSAALWFAGAWAHFLGCAKLAHMLGSPDLMPGFLKGVDEVFQHGISSAFDLALGVLWMFVVALATLPVFGAWFAADRKLADTRFADAPDAGLGVTWPVLTVTLLALLILPFQSHNLPASPTGLAVAQGQSFDAFLNTMAEACFAMVTILVLFLGLGAAGLFLAEYTPDGVWQLIAAILFGIFCSLVFGFVVGPWALALNATYGAVRGMTMLLAAWGALTGLPLLIVNRRT